MTKFYRKEGDATVYKDEALTQGIKDEAELASLGGIKDWGEDAANTNIQTIKPVTAGELYGDQTFNDEYGTAEDSYYSTLSSDYRNQTTATAEQDVLKKFQAEIDALENEKAAARQRLTGQYQQVGKARQGTATAIQARRGLLGSDMGEQYRDELTTTTNNEMNNAIAVSDAQYSDRRNALMGIVRTSQAEEAKARLEAAQGGAKAKLDEIKSRSERKTQKIASVIENALDNDTDLTKGYYSQLLGELATGLGTTTKELTNAYNAAKANREAEALKAEQDAAKAYKDTLMTLSEGQKIVDVNGNVIAQGAGKRVTLGYGDTLVDEETGEPIASGGEDPMMEVDMASKMAQIEKVYAEIENINDPYEKALKQAELDKLIAETEKITNGNSGTSGMSSYQSERSERTLQAVDNLLGQVSGWTTGYGSILSGIPESDARNFKAELDTLKSNIAFSELTAMREASKTGGALGAISDKETRLLEASLGALDTGQSPANFKKNLQQIKESINRWKNAVSQNSGVVSGSSDLDSIFG